MDRSAVFPIAMLDDPHAAYFDRPWVFEDADGNLYQHDTVEDACEHQRQSRVKRGFHPVTGERQ